MSEDFNARMQEGFELSPEHKYYFNGYTIAVSPNDVIIGLQHNIKTLALLSTNHIIAKTFAKAILTLLEDLEKNADYKIPTLDEIQGKLAESRKPQSAEE